MKKLFLSSFGLPIFLSIFISIFYIPFASVSDANISFTNNSIFSNYAWPTRGYTNITSKFGYRKAPANGASTYHGGIDIGAPEGANICSIADGTVSFARLVWSKWIYCHYFTRKWNFKHLWPCIRNFYRIYRSKSLKRANNCSCWSKICIKGINLQR